MLYRNYYKYDNKYLGIINNKVVFNNIVKYAKEFPYKFLNTLIKN